MDRDRFADLVGATLIHATPAANLPGIRARGLLRPDTLLSDAGLPPEAHRLRRDRVDLASGPVPALLNHQRPLLQGRGKDFLDGHTLDSWAAQLDGRIFFWPASRGARFFRSLVGAVILRLDTRRFFDAFAPGIWLSPINSGNASRRPARRGDWLYVGVDRGAEAFRKNRAIPDRGGLTRPDRVAEVSIRRDILRDLLASLVVRNEKDPRDSFAEVPDWRV